MVVHFCDFQEVTFYRLEHFHFVKKYMQLIGEKNSNRSRFITITVAKNIIRQSFFCKLFYF